jgi:hypothetical protein
LRWIDLVTVEKSKGDARIDGAMDQPWHECRFRVEESMRVPKVRIRDL